MLQPTCKGYINSYKDLLFLMELCNAWSSPLLKGASQMVPRAVLEFLAFKKSTDGTTLIRTWVQFKNRALLPLIASSRKAVTRFLPAQIQLNMRDHLSRILVHCRDRGREGILLHASCWMVGTDSSLPQVLGHTQRTQWRSRVILSLHAKFCWNTEVVIISRFFWVPS